MTDQVVELAQLGLALSEEDRARLAELLLDSLGAEPSSEVETAWDAEIRKRLAAYESGEVQAIDAEEVFTKAAQIAR